MFNLSKILPGLFLCFSLSVTASFGQRSFTEKEWEIISVNILQEHAEVVMLRENAKYDSLTIFEYDQAYKGCRNALTQSEIARGLEGQLKADETAKREIAEANLKAARKEIRNQKALKWAGFGLAAVAGYLAIKNAD